MMVSPWSPPVHLHLWETSLKQLDIDLKFPWAKFLKETLQWKSLTGGMTKVKAGQTESWGRWGRTVCQAHERNRWWMNQRRKSAGRWHKRWILVRFYGLESSSINQWIIITSRLVEKTTTARSDSTMQWTRGGRTQTVTHVLKGGANGGWHRCVHTREMRGWKITLCLIMSTRVE